MSRDMCDVSLRGLPGVSPTSSFNTAGAPMSGRQQPHEQGGISQSAMLVGTVAALQEESGQLRNQWKSDVGRLENELAQLRSAAAWALPQLAEEQNPAGLRLMNGAQGGGMNRMDGGGRMERMERSSSTGNLDAAALERAMMQGALNERLSRERGLDALLGHGTVPDRGGGGGGMLSREAAQLEAAMMQGGFAERASHQQGLEALAHQQGLEALLRQGTLAQGTLAERCSGGVNGRWTGSDGGGGGAGLSRQAQLEAAMMNGAQTCRGPRDQRELMMQRNSSTGNMNNVAGLTERMLSANQQPHDQHSHHGGSACGSQNTANERQRAANSVMAEQQALAEQQAKLHEAQQAKNQTAELYQELEKMSVALTEAQQENKKLKEDKEACENAHSRDVTMLEGMLQQLTADNDQLTKDLAKAEETIRLTPGSGNQHTMAQAKQLGMPPSTPTSIRSASIEPASEPGVEQAYDRIRNMMGQAHR